MAITDAQQAKQIMMKKGGPVHRHQLAKKRKDGKRPGYYGPDAGFGDDSYKDQAASSPIDQGQAPGGSDADFARARQAIDNRAAAAAAKAERERLERERIKREVEKINKNIEAKAKAKAKQRKDIEYLGDLENEAFAGTETIETLPGDANKDGKVGPIERFNYNARKKKQKSIQDRIDKKIRSGLEIVDPNINLTRSIKEMEMYSPTGTTYGDMVKEAVLGGSTFGNKGELIGAEFEKFSPKPGSAKEKYGYQPDFFTPIKTNTPSGIVQGSAALANFLGGAFMNKTPYEGKMTELADLYDKAAGLDLSKTSTKDMMRDFEPNRYALANNMIYDPIRKKFTPRTDGNDAYSQLPLLPIQQAGAKDSKDEDEENPFQLALAFRKDGGRVPYEDGGYTGGIMDLESGRQMYFLGKLVKKATRAVKKITKSPLGKAALLGLGAYYMPGFGIKASGGFSPFMKKFGFDAIKKKVGEASFGQLAGLSIGGGLLAGALAGKGYEDEDGDGFDDNTGFSVEEYRRRGAEGNVPIAFRADGGMSDVENDPQYKGWKRIFEVNPDAAEMHPKHKEFVKYYRSTDRQAKEEGGMMASAVGDESDDISMQLFGKPVKELNPAEMQELQEEIDRLTNKFRGAKGGIASMAEGGMMDLKGMEMDFREDGGFVPIGKKERADDVPARLSKNEFVMTADAVRGAGDGDIDKGAQKMYNLMSKLEAENDQSQGLDGARKMFKTAQRLEEVL